MKKQDLEQIYYLSRELKMWERELQTLRGKSLTGSSLNGSGSSPLGSHSDKVADRAEQTSLDLAVTIMTDLERSKPSTI